MASEAGEVIFYDDEADDADDIAGARYLEAAPSDIDVSGISGHGWGGSGTEVVHPHRVRQSAPGRRTPRRS